VQVGFLDYGMRVSFDPVADFVEFTIVGSTLTRLSAGDFDLIKNARKVNALGDIHIANRTYTLRRETYRITYAKMHQGHRARPVPKLFRTLNLASEMPGHERADFMYESMRFVRLFVEILKVVE
jgi:hypothetical protein